MLGQGEVGERDLLTGMLVAVAILVHHGGSGALHCDANQHKPIRCADFAEVTGHGIHHPKTLSLFSQVFAASSIPEAIHKFIEEPYDL